MRSFVQSDMGNEGARKFGLEKATTTLEDCTAFLASTVSWPPFFGYIGQEADYVCRLTEPRRRRLLVTSHPLNFEAGIML